MTMPEHSFEASHSLEGGHRTVTGDPQSGPTERHREDVRGLVVLFALIVFSSLVNSSTGAVSQLRNLSQGRHMEDGWRPASVSSCPREACRRAW